MPDERRSGDSRMRVSYDCGGDCSPKDWGPVAERAMFKAITSKYKTIVTDEPWPAGGRLVVSSDPGGTYIGLARWTPKSKRYVTCTAKVANEMEAAVPAFLAACKALAPIE